VTRKEEVVRTESSDLENHGKRGIARWFRSRLDGCNAFQGGEMNPGNIDPIRVVVMNDQMIDYASDASNGPTHRVPFQ
jgi:hypothetical protein